MSERPKRPWLPILALLLAGLVIYYPTLRSPFLLDDYLHAAMVDGTFPCKRGIFDLYDFVNDNAIVEFHPCDRTNDISLIRKNDKVVAVNSAIEIDLTGPQLRDTRLRSN
ncbi:MAG TPA: acetyl-CoA hydrolase/transferase C-terminal domain-containing protein, partial [Polyangium sp.]|nr:acetyl-CoA hydrolase/transferase C-terminal domain-containing protein [Polyangium sp.]